MTSRKAQEQGKAWILETLRTVAEARLRQALAAAA